MNSGMPEIFSAVIPLYNKRPYIRRAVNSVLGQTFPDFELIIVDDGSTDGSHEVLADVKDPRYRLLRQANTGEGPARNAGMAAAKGQWIAFLDADDMWLPDHLAELSKIAAAHHAAGLIATAIAEVTDGSLYQATSTHSGTIREVDYFLEASRRIGLATSSSCAVSRRAFNSVAGFGTARAGADLEYWTRVALQFPVAVSDRTTSVYFRGTGGVTETIAAEAKPLRPVATLADLSPSLATLCAAAEREPAILRRPGIRAYINARIMSGIRGSLVRNDVLRARSLARLMVQPLSLRDTLAVAALHVPQGSLKAGLNLYHRGRNQLRRRV